MTLFVIGIALLLVLLAVLVVNLFTLKEIRRDSSLSIDFRKEFEDITKHLLKENSQAESDARAELIQRLLREELAEKLRPLISDGFKPIEMLSELQRQNGERQAQQVGQLEQSVRGGLSLIQQRTAEDSIKQERAAAELRTSLKTEMEAIRRETEKQLTQMRVIVD